MDNQNRINYEQSQLMGGLAHHVPYGLQPSGVMQIYDRESGQDAESRKDISDILQQIMTITDQSLDEAQARFVLSILHYNMPRSRMNCILV